MRAAGAGSDDRFMTWQPADADIEEAAEGQPRERGEDEDKQSHAFRQYRICFK